MQKVLRPLSFRGLYDEAFSLLKENAGLLFSLTMLAYVPGFLLIAIFFPMSNENGDNPAAWMAFFGVLWLLVGVFMLQGTLTAAVSRRYLGESVTPGEAIKAVKSRLLPYIGTGLLSALLVAAGSCLIIPGIYAAFVLSFVIEVFVVEGLSGVNALRRSKQLAKGEFNNVFSISFITGVLIRLLTYVVVLLGALCVSSMPGIVGYAAFGLIAGLCMSLVMVINQTAMVVLYFDIRVRKEGFDIQLLANAIDGSAGSSLDQGGVVTVPAAPQVEAVPGASEDGRS